MKIYRISMPLPHNEIPQTQGELRVSDLLSESVIQYLDEKYGFRIKLGGGMFGVAYATFDNKVVKITTDKMELKVAKELMGSSWASSIFAKIYDIEEVEDVCGLYVIVKEKLTPLTANEQYLFDLLADKYDFQIDKVEADEPLHLPFFRKVEEYYIEVSNYPYEDTLNPENIGWDDNGNLKSFDPRGDSF